MSEYTNNSVNSEADFNSKIVVEYQVFFGLIVQ